MVEGTLEFWGKENSINYIEILETRCQLYRGNVVVLAKIKLQKSGEYGSPIGVSIDCIGCHESGYDRKRAKWRTKLARRAAIEEEEPITVQFMKRKIKFR